MSRCRSFRIQGPDDTSAGTLMSDKAKAWRKIGRKVFGEAEGKPFYWAIFTLTGVMFFLTHASLGYRVLSGAYVAIMGTQLIRELRAYRRRRRTSEDALPVGCRGSGEDG